MMIDKRPPFGVGLIPWSQDPLHCRAAWRHRYHQRHRSASVELVNYRPTFIWRKVAFKRRDSLSYRIVLPWLDAALLETVIADLADAIWQVIAQSSDFYSELLPWIRQQTPLIS